MALAAHTVLSNAVPPRGDTGVTDEGSVVEIRRTKQPALLGMLLIHAGEVVSTDRLVDGVSGDDAPSQSTSALQVRSRSIEERGVQRSSCPGPRDALELTQRTSTA
jgi:hypothetical protein